MARTLALLTLLVAWTALPPALRADPPKSDDRGAQGAEPNAPLGGEPIIHAPPNTLTAEAKKPAVESNDYVTKRYEFAGAPLLGGNSDIGFQFGFVGTLTRFADGVEPYRWNSDLVLAASLRNGPQGVEIAQQNYLLQIDMPEFLGSSVRTTITTFYQRTVDMGYFGIGNASSGEIPPNVIGPRGRYFEFDQHEAVVRALTRVPFHHPYQFLIATDLRYVSPSAYPGSRLAMDVEQHAVRGLRPLGIGSAAFGVAYDTRDNEVFTRRGAFHQIGIKGAAAVPTGADVNYGDFGAVLAGFIPIGEFVFAARGVIDAQFGHVPFYDLFTGGVFHSDEMPGGSNGVRGVPIGRYLGMLKFVANVEMRALLAQFHLLGALFHIGGDVFADTGRVWSDYTFSNPADGSGIGLKWGTGAGMYLQWGQAAIFRIEAAYSPDAAAATPNFPFGLYVAEGTMF